MGSSSGGDWGNPKDYGRLRGYSSNWVEEAFKTTGADLKDRGIKPPPKKTNYLLIIWGIGLFLFCIWISYQIAQSQL